MAMFLVKQYLATWPNGQDFALQPDLKYLVNIVCLYGLKIEFGQGLLRSECLQSSKSMLQNSTESIFGGNVPTSMSSRTTMVVRFSPILQNTIAHDGNKADIHPWELWTQFGC